MTSTSMQDIFENNSRRPYTTADEEQFNEAKKGLATARLDLYGPDAQHNINLIDQLFQKHRNIPITVANIHKAVEDHKNEFVWLTPAQANWFQLAKDSSDRANQLVAWLATQGKRPGQFVNTGDELFENLSLLFAKLHGYEINSETIRHAADRVAHTSGPQLHYIPEPRREGPRSEAAKSDDGTPFLGRNLNEPEWVRRSRERSEREAKEAASERSGASAQSAAAREAQRQAELIQGATHAETDQLRKLFSTSGTEIDWVQTLAARLQMQKQFNKQQEVRRFIR